MATCALSSPGGVISTDLGDTAVGYGTATSTGPGDTAATATVAVDPTGTRASAGLAGAAIVAVWLHLEVFVGSLKQGDRNSHIGSTCCWPSDIPLHDALLNCKWCIWRVLAAGPTATVGDATVEFDSCSNLY